MRRLILPIPKWALTAVSVHVCLAEILFHPTSFLFCLCLNPCYFDTLKHVIFMELQEDSLRC